MKMRFITRGFVLFAAIVWSSLFSFRCHIDHGLQPIHSKIGGRIQWTGSRVPLDSDEIRVAVIRTFPPRNIQELLFSDMLPFRDRDTTLIQTPVPWEIYVPPGRYDMVAVIWKENNESWNISDVVGIYGGLFLGDMLVPTFKPVTVPSFDSIVDTIDIRANLNRVNRDARISGTVAFRGKWPDNTGIVGIGAFLDIPRKGDMVDYYLKNAALDYGIPAFVETFDYQLRVRSADTIRYITVIWINASYDLTSLREIGFYADPSDPARPGTVTVARGETRMNVNISVDFAKF